jgi:uncharacterized protein
MMHSALYVGDVMHKRLRPRVHQLGYDIYSMLIDLDELPTLHQRLRLFSVDRFNLFSFHSRDRGDGSATPLKTQVEHRMRQAGIEPDGGSIRLLTMPRLLGWAFNPISVFLCHRLDGTIVAILWEVDNTFGQRHGYLLPAQASAEGIVRQSCDKVFYVSPFVEMEMHYAFRLKLPGERFAMTIGVRDADGLLLTARQRAGRRELSDSALLRAFLTIPFNTIKVVAGIHWEALKLWVKGIAIVPRPPPPAEPVSCFRQSIAATRSSGGPHGSV